MTTTQHIMIVFQISVKNKLNNKHISENRKGNGSSPGKCQAEVKHCSPDINELLYVFWIHLDLKYIVQNKYAFILFGLIKYSKD